MVVWSPGFRVSFFGLERLHPFDVGKADRVAAGLVAEGLVAEGGFLAPDPIDDAALARVHDPAWVAAVHRTADLARALELPIPLLVPGSWLEGGVREPFRRQVGGTVRAVREALRSGAALSLGGGFHHARPASGHGFCVYNDVAVALAAARSAGFAGQVAIVDTDAHQGDGNHAFFAEDPTVFTLSLHRGDLFPHPKVPGDHDVVLGATVGDEGYLAALDRALDRLTEVRPALVVHVAGADVLHDDPLAGLGLTIDGVVRRDRRVLQRTRELGAAFVQVLAGGYGPSAAEAQTRSAVALLQDLGGAR